MNVAINGRLIVGEHMEGIARFIYETTCQMATYHPEDQFYVFLDRKISDNIVFPKNVSKVVIGPQARHPILWRIWLDVMLSLQFRKYKIDVFYSGDGYSSLTTKVPTVLVIHDLAYLHYPEHIRGFALWDYRYFTPKYIAKAKHIIAVSQFGKNEIIRHFDVEASKISVAYNAVNRFQESTSSGITNLKLPENYLVYIGSINPRKNVVKMIEAVEIYNREHKENLKFVIAGKQGWKAEDIMVKILSSKDVVYLGAITEDQKYTIIQGSKAMMYCSLFEGFGIPILEAYSQSKPVITSNVSSMPEVAGNGGVLVDPHNPQDIARGIHFLLDNEENYTECVSKTCDILSAFSWKTSAQTIYSQLVNCK